MQCVMLLLVALVAAVQCKPQMVEWFQMTPAKYHKGATLEYKSYEEEFAAFKLKHNKSYPKELEGARYGIFEMNIRYIEKHNKQYAAGKKTYYLGINQFADMTREEFAMYNGLWRQRNRTGSEGCSSFLKPELFSVPEQVDWRKHGYVTPVKNQGQCGSCWSFSTTGSLEGQHFHKYKKLLSLSEQQLVDCSGKFGNEGCNGGLMDNAFEYIKAVGGLESESDYPYDATQDACHFNERKEVATCTGCVDVESGSEASLKDACGTVGPVSVAIDASHHSFQLYKGGVYNEPECSSTELDHGVLVAGYGTDEESGSDYWLVKNSWGTVWGEEGFVKMSRNRDNQCGIASQASYPLV